MGDLRTNYEQLAASYDEDRRPWQDVSSDDNIAALHEGSAVLDLACGTGAYLRAQAGYFPNMRFFGVDFSEGMLGHAVAKVPDGHFARGRAEALPFPDATFGYLNSGYAFHHFVDKDAALAEVVRVLGPRGRLRIVNIEPYSLTGWWVFRFFDGAFENDMQRFWPPERIASSLESLGCEVDVEVTVHNIDLPVAQALQDAERRVISQLAVLDDARYEAGLARLREIGDDDVMPSQSGALKLTATKR